MHYILQSSSLCHIQVMKYIFDVIPVGFGMGIPLCEGCEGNRYVSELPDALDTFRRNIAALAKGVAFLDFVLIEYRRSYLKASSWEGNRNSNRDASDLIRGTIEWEHFHNTTSSLARGLVRQTCFWQREL